MGRESDPDRLNQVLRQIRAIKHAEQPVVRLVYPAWPSPHKVAWRPWSAVPEAAKLSMLQDLVDWEGITNKDMAHILLSELDVGKLSAGQRDMLIRLAAPESGPDKLTLEDLKGAGRDQKNGHARPREPGIER